MWLRCCWRWADRRSANPGDPAGEPMEAAAEPAGVAAAAAGPYGPTSLQLKCKTLSSLSDWTAEHTLTVSPANPTTDDDIVVTYSFTAGPTNGPVPVRGRRSDAEGRAGGRRRVG